MTDVTGLDYLRARYYDSSAGTFLTEDSYQGELTDPLSQNLYSYVHNNPVNYTDPSGHFWKSIKKAASNAWNGVKKVASNAWNTVKRVATNTWNSVKSAYNTAVNWVSNKVKQAVHWASQQWNNYQSRANYHAAPSGGYGGGYGSTNSGGSSYDYTQQQQAQQRAQAERRRQQAIRDEYTQATGIKGTPKSREGQNLLRNWGAALAKTLKHVCTTAERVSQQIVKAAKKIDWKKVAVTAGAIGVGIALTVATGGLGAPVAMAIGGAASGAVLSGYDAYSSGKRGWALAGSVAKGAGLGALTGFVGGSFMGAGASVATNVTQNIANHTVRQVVSASVEAGVETAIDTGISIATGNPITIKNVVTDYGLNLITNGSGSVSTKKSAAAEVPVTKPRKDVTPVQQLALPGPTSKPLALPAPKSTPKTDFYVNPDGTVYSAADISNSSKIDKLYHYTSDEGIEGIVSSGQMRPSLKANNPKDARYGNGQYFTDISPGTLTNPQLSSKFITIPFQGNKFSNYIEIDATGLGVVKERDGVFVVPNDKVLDISNRIIDYGKIEVT